MKRLMKIFLCVIAFGLLLSIVGFLAGAKPILDINNGIAFYSSDKIVNESHMSDEPFDAIESTVLLNVDVSIVPSTQYGYQITTTSPSNYGFLLQANRLSIGVKDTDNTDYLHPVIGFDFHTMKFIDGKTKIKIFVPSSQILKELYLTSMLGSLTIKGETIESFTGFEFQNIKLTDTIIHNLNLSDSEYFDITINAKNCNLGIMDEEDGNHHDSGKVSLLNGNINFDNCKIENEDFTFRSHGSFTAKHLTASDISIKTSNGNMNLFGKLFGMTTLASQTGDINLSVNGKAIDYNVNMITESGLTKINGTNKTNQQATSSGQNTIQAMDKYGDINVHFTK